VVDNAFDTVMCDRPYYSTITAQKAVNEIRLCNDTEFVITSLVTPQNSYDWGNADRSLMFGVTYG